jgi:iron(III) transport system ATP-binding protein
VRVPLNRSDPKTKSEGHKMSNLNIAEHHVDRTSPPTVKPQVEITGLTKVFRRRSGAGDVIPINDVSLSIATGEFLVLLGPSGCGKTTLLRSVAGLERPDEGSIRIQGTEVYNSKSRLFVPPNRRPISMIFQSYALWPHMTVFKNIAYPLKSKRMPRDQVEVTVTRALERVGLSGLERQYPGQLSGGQQQRVALARALVTEAQVLLFDEPLSNVDAKVREELRTQLVEMQRELGFTALYVTHDQAEAMELADRIAVLNSGRIEQLAAPREVYSRPTSRYVADFVGTANLSEGIVTGESDDAVTVRTAIGEVSASHVSGYWRGSALAVGDTVSTMFRPEDCVVGSTWTDGPNAWPAQLVRVSFTGTQQHLLLTVGEQHIQVTVAKDASFDEGGEVWLSVPPSKVHLLPATAPTAAEQDGTVDEVRP